MKEQKELKHKVLEVLEGGLRGNTAAQIFSIVLIVLIITSILFMVIWDAPGMEKWHGVFEIIENLTVGIFTIELILGFWTADVRYPEEEKPRLHYLCQPMTIIQMLAILPFYLGVYLGGTGYRDVAKYFELLKLLHLLKILEIAVHAYREGKENSGED